MRKYLFVMMAVLFAACGSPADTSNKVVYIDGNGRKIVVNEGVSGLLLQKASASLEIPNQLLLYVYDQLGNIQQSATIDLSQSTVFPLSPGTYSLFFQGMSQGESCSAIVDVVVYPRKLTPVHVVLSCPQTGQSGITVDVTAVTNVPTWYFLAATDTPYGYIPTTGTTQVLKFEIVQDLSVPAGLYLIQFDILSMKGVPLNISSCELMLNDAPFLTMNVTEDWYEDDTWKHSVVSAPMFDLLVAPEGVRAELYCTFEGTTEYNVMQFILQAYGPIGESRTGSWLQGRWLQLN